MADMQSFSSKHKKHEDNKSYNDTIIYLIRHGEKPPKLPNGDDANGLSAAGLTRAQGLISVFGASSIYNIGCVIAEKPKKDGSRTRPYETIKPLCESLSLIPNLDISRDKAKDVAAAAKDWKGEGNVLICWEHGVLGEIAEVLVGADDGDIKYPGDRFDLIWKVWKDVKDWKFEVVGSEGVPGLDEKWMDDGGVGIVDPSLFPKE